MKWKQHNILNKKKNGGNLSKADRYIGVTIMIRNMIKHVPNLCRTNFLSTPIYAPHIHHGLLYSRKGGGRKNAIIPQTLFTVSKIVVCTLHTVHSRQCDWKAPDFILWKKQNSRVSKTSLNYGPANEWLRHKGRLYRPVQSGKFQEPQEAKLEEVGLAKRPTWQPWTVDSGHSVEVDVRACSAAVTFYSNKAQRYTEREREREREGGSAGFRILIIDYRHYVIKLRVIILIAGSS